MPRRLAALLLTALLGLVPACHTAPQSETRRDVLVARADLAVADFKAADPSLMGFFDTAAGWAVFPSVGKGGAGFGGAYGKGVLYVAGDAVGFCDLSQATVGLQLGGQSYAEIIFFDTAQQVAAFQSGRFAFAAQASAVAATRGAAADADYEDGVAVFTMRRGGLMFEASVGGQRFDYVPR